MVSIPKRRCSCCRFARVRQAQERSGRHCGEQGFTLVEMLVVITIIGLIMGLIGPRVLNYLSESKAKAAKIQMQSFASALDLFYLDAGRYPSASEGLAALVRQPPGVSAWKRSVPERQRRAERSLEQRLCLSFAGGRARHMTSSPMVRTAQEGGAGVAADISLENTTTAKNE